MPSRSLIEAIMYGSELLPVPPENAHAQDEHIITSANINANLFIMTAIFSPLY